MIPSSTDTKVSYEWQSNRRLISLQTAVVVRSMQQQTTETTTEARFPTHFAQICRPFDDSTFSPTLVKLTFEGLVCRIPLPGAPLFGKTSTPHRGNRTPNSRLTEVRRRVVGTLARLGVAWESGLTNRMYYLVSSFHDSEPLICRFLSDKQSEEHISTYLAISPK